MTAAQAREQTLINSLHPRILKEINAAVKMKMMEAIIKDLTQEDITILTRLGYEVTGSVVYWY